MISILLGLGAALTWGAADFGGGFASKRMNSYGVVIGSHIISMAAFIVLAILLNEPIPPIRDWLIGGAAGLAGGFGLMLLYRALAEGKMSIAAPVSAVVAAAISVFVASLTQGLPGNLILLGFRARADRRLAALQRRNANSNPNKRAGVAAHGRRCLRFVFRSVASSQWNGHCLADRSNPHRFHHRITDLHRPDPQKLASIPRTLGVAGLHRHHRRHRNRLLCPLRPIGST